MKKRNRPLPKAEAISRIDTMVPKLIDEVRVGLKVEAAMETLNDVIHRLEKKTIIGPVTMATTQHAYVVELLLALAKLYDLPAARKRDTPTRRHNESDVVSIPLLLRLLKQERCQKVLCERAKDWSDDGSHVREAIQTASAKWAELRKTHTGRMALSKLKQYRNRIAAHALLVERPDQLPRYNELFQLLDVAAAVVGAAELAVTGNNRHFDAFERLYREDAEAFWGRAVPAVLDPT